MQKGNVKSPHPDIFAELAVSVSPPRVTSCDESADGLQGVKAALGYSSMDQFKYRAMLGVNRSMCGRAS